MDLLLNPNVAYLLLVAGLLLAALAVLSPGTGLLEIGALVALLAAGWGAYNLPINLWALGVIVLGILPFVLAVRNPGRWLYLVLSIAALVVGSAFLFRGQGWQPAVHPVLALVVSALTAGFFWLVAGKALEAERIRPSHDLTSVIGAIGEAKTDIYQEGTVQVAGELWSAYSDSPIPAETTVKVVGREGFILQVQPADNRQ